MNRTCFVVAAMALAFSVATAGAQVPAPATTPAPVAAAPAPPAGPSPATVAALQLLQTMKAANEETIRRQAATLAQLEELEKAVDQIKIFSKRG
ncbi:MAG: hypothetical protein H0V56_07045 [Chthoniobacterales bacterium]|nr:hypothetical protein [Chthoniobacterales bacterium]